MGQKLTNKCEQDNTIRSNQLNRQNVEIYCNYNDDLEDERKHLCSSATVVMDIQLVSVSGKTHFLHA